MKGSDLSPNGGTFHNGTLLKVSKDGSKLEIVAVGFRAPNGLCIGPNGEITNSDNQGNWTPESPINWIKPGNFYGYVLASHPNSKKDTPRANPICWIPMNVDNSAGSQVWVTSDKWGPFKGHLLHTSYGKCSLFTVLMEDINGEKQGGVVKFPFKFISGGMRARFNPKDGQLYVSGLKGWQSDANRDGCFHRIRYTGKPTNTPISLHVLKDGVQFSFSDPLDTASAGDVQNYSVEWFNVVRSSAYGSPEFYVSDAKKKGREPVDVDSVTVGPDRKTVTLKIPGIKPVTNMVIKYKLKAADGTIIDQEIDNTINVIP
jgi:hypothetical protein